MDDLRPIVQQFVSDLEAWLAQPSPEATKLDELRDQVNALKNSLGAAGLTDALKGFELAAKNAKRVKQREAAEIIAELCKPTGVILHAGEPPKRRRKANASADAVRPESPVIAEVVLPERSGNIEQGR